MDSYVSVIELTGHMSLWFENPLKHLLQFIGYLGMYGKESRVYGVV